jgi:hypothetical protein
MPATTAPTLATFAAQMLDALAEARSAEAALGQVDLLRREVAGDGIFSIQQNVTTGHDPANEIRLRRFYSSEAGRFPVQGTKRKTLTPWTERLFVQGRPFVGEGADVLARTFDDFEQMRPWGVRSVVNVPLLQGRLCYATFNVFGTRAQWSPQAVLGIRLLALAAARWVPPAPGLAYRFTDAPAGSPLEA